MGSQRGKYTCTKQADELYLFPKGHVFHSSKLKEFADDNFKFNENGRKFSKWAENTVGKGEIDLKEQFLLFPQYFKRLVLQTRKNQGLFGKEFKHILGYCYLFTKRPNFR